MIMGPDDGGKVVSIQETDAVPWDDPKNEDPWEGEDTLPLFDLDEFWAELAKELEDKEEKEPVLW